MKHDRPHVPRCRKRARRAAGDTPIPSLYEAARAYSEDDRALLSEVLRRSDAGLCPTPDCSGLPDPGEELCSVCSVDWTGERRRVGPILDSLEKCLAYFIATRIPTEEA